MSDPKQYGSGTGTRYLETISDRHFDKNRIEGTKCANEHELRSSLQSRFGGDFSLRRHVRRWEIDTPEKLSEEDLFQWGITSRTFNNITRYKASGPDQSIIIKAIHYPFDGIHSEPVDMTLHTRPGIRHNPEQSQTSFWRNQGADRRPVYAASAEIRLRGGSSERKNITVAVKVLQHPTWRAESSNWIRAGDGTHPNIIDVFSAFYENKQFSTYMLSYLVLPLAQGSLGELLFREDPLENTEILSKTQDLWSQFEGLASGLQYLHDSCRIAHTRLSPAKILLYDSPHLPGLTAVITGFSKSIRQDDTSEHIQLSLRGTFREWNELAQKDVQDLGIIFVCLLTYLILGHSGIKDLQVYMPFQLPEQWEYVSFDEAEFSIYNVLLNWVSTRLHYHNGAERLHGPIHMMLGRKEYRPTAELLVRIIRGVCTEYHWDRDRILQFVRPSLGAYRRSVGDHVKEYVEKKLHSAVHWWPLSQGSRYQQRDMSRILWKWTERVLEISIPIQCALEYKKHCTTMYTPIELSAQYIPPHASAKSGSTVSATSMGNGFISRFFHSVPQSVSQSSDQTVPRAVSPSNTQPSLNVTPNTPVPLTRSLTPPSRTIYNPDKELYWCIDRPWSEQQHTLLRPVNVYQQYSDVLLFQALSKAYNEVRGGISGFFSLRSCVGVDFIKFGVVYDHESRITPVTVGLPGSTNSDYEYQTITPDDVHMKIAAVQIIEGMRKPRGIIGTRTLALIPKRSPPTSRWVSGSYGWGIHAVQGYSFWKIMVWLGGVTGVGMVIAVTWLAAVNNKDLQNAFMPMTVLLTMMGIGLGIPHLMGIA